MTKKWQPLTDDERQAQIDAAQAAMAASVAEIRTSDDWLRHVEFAARFHRYSFRNCLLLEAQATARGMAPLSHVAPFTKWRDLNRAPVKGSKALKVWAPVVKRTKDDTEDNDSQERGQKLVGWRLASVFDIQQTDGEPVPELPSAALPDGEVPAGLLDSLHELAASLGFPIDYGEPGRDRRGVTIPSEHRIVIRAGMAEASEVRTTLHELAHVLLHCDPETPYEYREHRGVAETEAESVAFTVATLLGLQLGPFSFHYVAGWAPDLDTVLAVGKRVSAASKRILEGLEAAADEAPTAATGGATIGAAGRSGELVVIAETRHVDAAPKRRKESVVMETYRAMAEVRKAEIEAVTHGFEGDKVDARERLGLQPYTLKEHLQHYGRPSQEMAEA